MNRAVLAMSVVLLLASNARALDAEPSDEFVFPRFSIAPTLGFGYTFESSEVDTELGYNPSIAIPARPSFDVRLGLDFGGAGFGFGLTPFVRLERAEAASFNSYGFEAILNYRLRFGRVFPHVGLGVHLGYLGGDDSDAGLEAMGRLPVGATWYLWDKFAWFAEFGVMYGVTAYIGSLFSDFQVVRNLGIDFSLGVRFF